MKPLLKHLVEMTGYRDHTRLEISVISALTQLAGAQQVQALELFELAGGTWLRPRIWSDNGRFVANDNDAASDPAREPLARYPDLAAAVAAAQPSAVGRRKDGARVLWLLIWARGRARSCLEIVHTSALTANKREVIHGIFLVYQNYQNLLDYSERDALTGLLNRKTFDDQFARQSLPPGAGDASSQQYGHWLAVADIDHFKQVNDRFGHLYGDEVLILVANILKTSFGVRDRIFRFGGEEFVMLLRDMSLAGVRSALEQCRATIEQHDFPQVGRVTVSIGFTQVSVGSPVETLGQADQALYHAKGNGRNQVAFHGDLVAGGLLAAKVAHDDIELF
ncbi:GGDEF domain-containing protein [Xylophilus sp.]|uniref:GGDEF domain-containing protein n=1 Tax=Xylophilus sp. TaxID=2653893 RepID=UPI0013BAB5C4|nr:GGDEF domain-containing protein [Xylophilus sp.]KAF1044011.1 MAG: putative diguanylate cyclase DgcT [Xylophilus sp.]